MKIKGDAVIINQCSENSTENINIDGFNIRWVNSKERGLGRSRNMALKNATADICILADDDLEYVPNYEDIILKQFKLHPSADIIAFQVEGIGNKYKKYHQKPRDINYLSSMRISSVEIAFKLDKVKKSKTSFNDLFGAGAKYNMGEESIFLIDCLRNGLKIKYVPVKIADLHLGNSTWFRGYNKSYFIGKGAQFTAMSNLFSISLIIQFAIRKHKLFKNKITIFNAIKYMLDGRNKYLKEKKVKNKR